MVAGRRPRGTGRAAARSCGRAWLWALVPAPLALLAAPVRGPAQSDHPPGQRGARVDPPRGGARRGPTRCAAGWTRRGPTRRHRRPSSRSRRGSPRWAPISTHCSSGRPPRSRRRPRSRPSRTCERELEGAAAPLRGWKDELAAEAKRVARDPRRARAGAARLVRRPATGPRPPRRGTWWRGAWRAPPGPRRRRGAPAGLAGARARRERPSGRSQRRGRGRSRAATGGDGRRGREPLRSRPRAALAARLRGRAAQRVAARPGGDPRLQQEHARVRQARCTSARRAGVPGGTPDVRLARLLGACAAAFGRRAGVVAGGAAARAPVRHRPAARPPAVARAPPAGPAALHADAGGDHALPGRTHRHPRDASAPT